MKSGGMLTASKYELIPQTSYQYKNDYRFNYGETVSLYKLETGGSAGSQVWTVAQDQKLPLGASGLVSASVVAIALLLQF
jgi:hypothetical protein